MAERTVLITGCSSGIGLASAREMKARGWRVFATARKPEDIARLKARGGCREPLSRLRRAGLHRRGRRRRCLQATGGTLDALFNNGAYGQPGAVEDLKPRRAARPVRGEFLRLARSHRAASSRPCGSKGRAASCSAPRCSASSRRPIAAPIAPSKFAVEALADALRLELAGDPHQGGADRAGTDRLALPRACARSLSPPYRSRRLASSRDLS